MFDDISKTTIIKNFKKKSKYIKKNNLFEFQNESISVINEFLAYIVGFNNYKEFISTNFSDNDSRFDLFYYHYQSNKKNLLKRVYLFLINLENKNQGMLSIDRDKFNTELDSILMGDSLHSESLYGGSFYKDICLLEGENKKFAYKRTDSLYNNNIKHNKLIILNTFNSEDYFQKIIFENNNNIKDSIICNLSSMNLNNSSIKEYSGIEGWLEFKNNVFKKISGKIENEINDVIKTPKIIKKKNLFLIVDSNFFHSNNGVASFVAFSSSCFNLFIITSQISLMNGDENEITSIFYNSFIRFVNLSGEDFDRKSFIFKLFFESIKFPDNDILNQFKAEIFKMKPYSELISEVSYPNLPYYSKYSFVRNII